MGLTSKRYYVNGHWLIDAKVSVNLYYPVVPYTPTYNQIDGQSVVTHELGHVVGLNEYDAEPAVMNSTIGYGVVKRNLYPSDNYGLFALYLQSSACTTESTTSIPKAPQRETCL